MKKSSFALNLASILVLAAVSIVAIVMTNRSNDADRFSVSASGVVYARADIAHINIGFKTDIKQEAAQASTESVKKMNDIMKVLIDLEVDEKDIKTTNYNLRPVYRWTDDAGQVLQGYEASQNLSLKVRDLDKIGEIISLAAEKGANQIGDINFSIDDEYELKNQARELAIEKAKEKAELIASQSGMIIGKVKSFYENSHANYPMPMYANAKQVADIYAESGLESAEIQVGQNEIRVEVTLVYEVK